MASLTSLYLCSRTVYAAVGSPTAKGARITAAATAQLPEGCLINGVIPTPQRGRPRRGAQGLFCPP